MHPSNRKKGNMWGGRHGAGLVNRPQTLRSCKALRGMVRSVVSWSWWGNVQEFWELLEAMLATWYQSWWEYFYHRSQQMLQIRAPAFSRELFVKLLWPPTGLCPKTTRNRLIGEGQCFPSSWVVLGRGCGALLGSPWPSHYVFLLLEGKKPSTGFFLPLSQSWPFVSWLGSSSSSYIPIEELVSPPCDFLPRLEYQTRSTRLAVSQACKI